MTSQKKICLWISGGIVAFIAALILLTQVYINSASVKGSIEAVVSKRLGGTVAYEKLDISLLPRPHVSISKLNIRYPKTFRGTLQSLSIYPQILPLFSGKLRFAKIRIVEPDFRIILPETVSASTTEAPSVEEAKQNIRSVLRYLELIGAGLVTEMDNGKFLFRRSRKDFLLLKNVTVHFNAPPGDIKILVKASTEQWGDFSLKGTYSFSEEKTEIKDLAISMGRSSLSGFSAVLYWESVPTLDIRSGSVILALDQIYSWLSSSENLTPFLRHVRLQRGELIISSLQGGGPIDDPGAWNRKMTGELKDVLAESHWLPAPVSVSTRFAIENDTIDVTGFSAQMGRSSLQDISGQFIDKKDPEFSVSDGRASIDVSEVFLWRTKYKKMNELLKDVENFTGEISFSTIRMGGPLLRPEKWRVNITGAAKNMVIAYPLLPTSLAVSGGFKVEEGRIAISDTFVRLGTSSLSNVSASISDRETPVLEILSARALIHGGELFRWRDKYPALDAALSGVDDLQGDLTLTSFTFKGLLFHPEKGRITAAGGLDHVFISSAILPGPVGLLRGDFKYVPDNLSFSLHEATILDSSLTGTALISGITSSVRAIDLTLEGSSGRKTLDWVYHGLELPQDLMIKTPIALRNSHLVWDRTAGIKFNGTISVAEGLAFQIDLTQHGTDLDVRRLLIRDQETNATLTLNWQKQRADISYSGVMAQSTLSRIFEQGNFGKGSMRGYINAVIRTDQPLRSRINGSLMGGDIFIPWGMTVPTTINTIVIKAEGDVLTVDRADFTWGKNQYPMKGAATTSDEGIAFSMALKADGIDVQAIQQSLQSGKKSTKEQKTRTFPMPPVRGDLRADSDYIKFGRFTFAPAHTVISVDPDWVSMDFYDTKTCGISLKGSTLISRESVSFIFIPSAKNEQLAPTVDCLAGKDLHITGEYDLTANVKAQGKIGELFTTLDGRVDFKARNGKIYHYPLLQKILSVLSVLEVFRGRTPEIGGSGFPYHSMALQGDIHKGKFTVEKAYIGGESLDIIATGEVDIGGGKMDVVVLVAPFSTLNWIIRHIPIVSNIMGGTLISIPVRVSGDLTNPDVTFLSPKAVGSRILNIFENIIKLPADIISPLLRKEREKQKEETK